MATATRPKPTKKPQAKPATGKATLPEMTDVAKMRALLAAPEPDVMQESDDTVLLRSLSYGGGVFAELARHGAADDAIAVEIRSRWSKAKVFGARPYTLDLNHGRWGMAIWIGVSSIPRVYDDPTFYHRKKTKTAGYEGTLIDAVRRVFEIPQINGAPIVEPPAAETAAVPAKGKTKANGKPEAKPAEKVTAETLLAGMEVIDERDLPLGEIKRSKENPRQSFDETLIADMAPSIVNICRLNPLTVREGSLELIDGETRHRAGERAKASALRCKVVRCTDAQAAYIRLLSSVQRRGLNDIERASALKALTEQHGASQRQLESVVDMKQGSISNLLRLLELPEIWKQRVISGEITGTAARNVVPWADEPEVMAELERLLKNCGKEDRSRRLGDLVERAARESSRPLNDHYYWDGKRQREVKLNPSDEQKKLLRVRKVGSWGQRAFNIELWEEMQTAAEKKRADRAQSKSQSTKGGNSAKQDPAKAKENARKQQEQLARKLYRFRTSWYQAMAIHAMDRASAKTLLALSLFIGSTADGASRRTSILDESPLWAHKSKRKNSWQGIDRAHLLRELLQIPDDATGLEVTRDLVKKQLAEDFCGYYSIMKPDQVETLAVELGVDLARQWSHSFEPGQPCEALWDDFQGLWSKDQIVDLLKEWNLKPPANSDSAKRKDLQALMPKTKPCPKAILQAKEVSI